MILTIIAVLLLSMIMFGIVLPDGSNIYLRFVAFFAICGVAILMFNISDADAKRKNWCQSKVCQERVARKQCSQKRVVPCIKRAAIHYRQSFSDMLRVAKCESGLDPYNEYKGHYGLFQFLRSTFATTKYAGKDINSAKWNSLATGWMWANGRRGEWACQ